ncbi:MAG: plasmid maintenance system antidote protein [Bacteroidota bacterium]|nr:plasmid maintenance system antidote protein [Bacteroidota bacterium]
MTLNVNIIKGVHPGVIIERELRIRNISVEQFAREIDEAPAIVQKLISQKLKLKPSISLKIEKVFDLEEGTLLILQAYYEVAKEKQKRHKNYHPDLKVFRPVVFWDTNIKTIDWDKSKSAVIQRVFERGNAREIEEIIRFYGKNQVEDIMANAHRLMPVAIENLHKYLR